MDRFMTTSWDDGHPLDLEIAQMLAERGLRGTFYTPREAETDTLSAAELKELAHTAELGAHTLHHVTLTEVTPEHAREEIADSREWIEDITGTPCAMFCPPRGQFTALHVRMAHEAGFTGMRTVELLSLDLPRTQEGLQIMPTTVQVYGHGTAGYARNVLKRMAWRNAPHILEACGRDWPSLARTLLEHVVDHGGVFHLWGHAWEVQAANQWGALAEVLDAMQQAARHVPCVTNGELATQTQTVPCN